MMTLVTGQIPNPEKPGETYQVSFVCANPSSVVSWILEIISRKGTYVVQRWAGL